MNQLGWGTHAAVVVALVINLWVGGDYIESWFGHGWRSVFEITLILGWLTLIVGMRAPLPWRRPREDAEDHANERGEERR